MCSLPECIMPGCNKCCPSLISSLSIGIPEISAACPNVQAFVRLAEAQRSRVQATP